MMFIVLSYQLHFLILIIIIIIIIIITIITKIFIFNLKSLEMDTNKKN